MKNFFCLLLCVGFLAACNNSTERLDENGVNSGVDSTGIMEYSLNEEKLNAVDYNNRLSLIQQGIFEKINRLFVADTNLIRNSLENVKFELELNLNDLEKITPPAGGESFKTAIENLLNFYKAEMSGGFEEIVPLLIQSHNALTPAERDRLVQYDTEFAKKEMAYFEEIRIVQEKFAQENNFQMQDL
jgi:hypothetical protein